MPSVAGAWRVNGQPAKPSKDVRPGDRIELSAGVLRMELTVRATAERRLPGSEWGGGQLYEGIGREP